MICLVKESPETCGETHRYAQVIGSIQSLFSSYHIAYANDVIAYGVDVSLHRPGAVEYEGEIAEGERNRNTINP